MSRAPRTVCLKEHGNTGSGVIEKTLVDHTGLILLSTGARFAGAMETNKEDSLTLRIEDQELFAQIKALKYGTISRDENDRRIIYCVNYLPIQDWYYVEKIDVTSTLSDTL